MTEPWTELLTRANRATRRVFGNRCLQGIDADDAAQSWLIRQWKNGTTDLTWAYRNAHRNATRVASQRQRDTTRRAFWDAEPIPHDTADRSDDTSGLADAVNSLPKADRAVVVEWMASGCSQRAAARSLGMDQATYHRHWHEALARLRVLLEGDDE